MIPDFIKPENIKDEKNIMVEALKKYEAHFGRDITTECTTYTDEEWANLLEYCIRVNEPVENIIGGLDDDDDDIDI